MSDIVPDLVTSFSGAVQPLTDAPATLFGLAVPDLAIVIFIFSSLLALPFILLSARQAPEG